MELHDAESYFYHLNDLNLERLKLIFEDKVSKLPGYEGKELEELWETFEQILTGGESLSAFSIYNTSLNSTLVIKLKKGVTDNIGETDLPDIRRNKFYFIFKPKDKLGKFGLKLSHTYSTLGGKIKKNVSFTDPKGLLKTKKALKLTGDAVNSYFLR